RFKVSLLNDDMYSIAMKEAMMLNSRTIPMVRQRMKRQFRMAISRAVVPANRPEIVTDSP
ncbi:MAG: hypothetical protein IKA03_00845, partial [Alphaproteobacteria bacterium]|nr:hypothetical protein [Alphaproteobacteria bacterium]